MNAWALIYAVIIGTHSLGHLPLFTTLYKVRAGHLLPLLWQRYPTL